MWKHLADEALKVICWFLLACLYVKNIYLDSTGINNISVNKLITDTSEHMSVYFSLKCRRVLLLHVMKLVQLIKVFFHMITYFELYGIKSTY